MILIVMPTDFALSISARAYGCTDGCRVAMHFSLRASTGSKGVLAAGSGIWGLTMRL